MKRLGMMVLMVMAGMVWAEPLHEVIYVPKERFTAYTINPPGADLVLDLKAAEGYEILWHDIRCQDWADCVQWIKDDTRVNSYKLHMVYYNGWPDTDLKRSSREWLAVTGGVRRILSGPGAGIWIKDPLFEADVLSVNLDFVDVKWPDRTDDPDLTDETREETIGAYVGLTGPLTPLIIEKIECKEIPESILNNLPVKFEQETNRKVKIWSNPDRTGTPIVLPKVYRQWELPKTVYVEPLEVSLTERDLVFKVGCRFEKLADSTGTTRRWVEAIDRVKMTVYEAGLKAVLFSSDHGVLQDYHSNFGGVGTVLYTPRGWVKGEVNNPISHTRNINVSVNVTLKVSPSGLPMKIHGNNWIPGFTFDADFTSTGADQTITLTSLSKLNNKVDILEPTIAWSLKSQKKYDYLKNMDDSGPHKVFVTCGSPGYGPTFKRVNFVCSKALYCVEQTPIAKAIWNAISEETNFGGFIDGWSLLDQIFDGGDCDNLARCMTYAVEMLGQPAEVKMVRASVDAGAGNCLELDYSECPRHGEEMLILWFPESGFNFYEGTCKTGNRFYAVFPKYDADNDYELLKVLINTHNVVQRWGFMAYNLSYVCQDRAPVILP